ncbi:MAG: 50S ribosomal protein L13 [Parcubacteria group bacterium]|nr:50S ribosomal protein L13 [Parcubacteria group bacterium]
MKRGTHTIDAGSDSLGRLASKIAVLLRGKHKVDYMPGVDMGDFVLIENIKNLRLTGKKLAQKDYYSHSQYLGKLKVKKFREVFAKDPLKILRMAVYNMLPKNKLRADIMLRLKTK